MGTPMTSTRRRIYWTSATALFVLGGALCACDRRRLDVVGDASTTSAAAPAPAAPARAGVEAPSSTGTVTDENNEKTEPLLPSWVPDSGRLTIVGAGDRDRNLGIVVVRDDAGAREGLAPPVAP